VNISILHVDDDPNFAGLVADMLGREDDRFTVATATNANEGIERLATGNFDCVISDYDMPGQNGIEFLGQVRDEYPDLPFILFTGKGSEDVASEAISAGVTDYLQKGSGTEQYELLANRIRNVVERAQAQRNYRRHLSAIETAQEGISILDNNGEFVYVNEAYSELYGYDPNELVGEHWEILYRDNDVQRMQNEVLPTVKAEGHWHGETTGVRADGSTFVEDHTLALTDTEKIICAVRDITEHKQREQAIKALHSTAQAFMEAQTAEEIAEIAVGAARDILDLPKNGVYLYDETEERLVPTVWADQVEDLIGKPPTFAPGDSIAWTAFQTQEAQIYNNISTSAEPYNPDTNVRSEIILPLDDHGVVIIGSGEPDAFDAIDVDLARTLATHATTALDRVDREQTLREYEMLVETVGDPMFVLDADGTFQVANNALLARLNAAEATVIGTHASEFMSNGDFEQGTDLIEELLNTPVYQSETYEITAITTAGDRIPAEVNLAPLTDNAAMHGVVGVIREITERKERERALKHLQQRTQELMHTTTNKETAQVAVEAAHDVMDVPLSSCHLVDDEQRRLKPTAVVDTLDEEISEAPSYERAVEDAPAVEIVWQTFESGEPLVIDDIREYNRLAEVTRARSAIIHPLNDYGVFIVSATQPNAFNDTDTTLAEIIATSLETALDRVDREQRLERQNDRLNEFTSVVSHDLRNPINVAQGYLDLAREECDSEHLDNVVQAHDRTETLLDDLLTLAQHGERVKERKTVKLADLADTCWHTVMTANATLITETSQTIQADSSRLKQLLENLFRNSAKHAGENITVTVGDLDAGFYVADDGSGIPADERDVVFEAGHSTVEDGTGFGLNIVQEIAEADGWEVSVTDSKNGGARFEITGVETTTT
jgi:PAS domain S-box-containing protein